MSTSPRANATYYASGQANGYLKVNDILNKLEAFAQLTVLDRDLSTPPGSPSNGDCYIVKATGTGAWAGQDGKIAVYYNGWLASEAGAFLDPIEGMRVYVADEDTYLVYNGSAWKGVPVTPLGPNCPRQYRSVLQIASTVFSPVSDSAYFAYMGRTSEDQTPLHVCAVNLTAAGVSVTAEVGLFSTPNAPNKAAQTMTRIATASLTGMTTTGHKRNSTPFATLVPAGTHLWAAIWMTWSTAPGMAGVVFDMGQGYVQVKTAAGALSLSSSFVPSIPAFASTPVCPLLSIELD